jgi:hypothetical protein
MRKKIRDILEPHEADFQMSLTFIFPFSYQNW